MSIGRRFKGTLVKGTLAFGVLAVLSNTQALATEFKFAVEPNYTQDKQVEVYGPLIQYLNKNTGHHFTLVTSRNFQFFWRDIRQEVPVD